MCVCVCVCFYICRILIQGFPSCCGVWVLLWTRIIGPHKIIIVSGWRTTFKGNAWINKCVCVCVTSAPMLFFKVAPKHHKHTHIASLCVWCFDRHRCTRCMLNLPGLMPHPAKHPYDYDTHTLPCHPCTSLFFLFFSSALQTQPLVTLLGSLNLCISTCWERSWKRETIALPKCRGTLAKHWHFPHLKKKKNLPLTDTQRQVFLPVSEHYTVSHSTNAFTIQAWCSPE